MNEPATPPENNIPLIHPEESTTRRFHPQSSLIIAVIVLLGVGAGFGVAYLRGVGKAGPLSLSKSPEAVVAQAEENVFRDKAEGTIAKKGPGDPAKFATGTHKLLREGGPTQTVYLISSIYNLDDYDGKKVRVFGETLPSENVGWLLNVGKIEEIK